MVSWSLFASAIACLPGWLPEPLLLGRSPANDGWLGVLLDGLTAFALAVTVYSVVRSSVRLSAARSSAGECWPC